MCDSETHSNQLFCYFCKNYTKTVEPMVLQRVNNFKFHICGLCEKCNRTKSKFILSYKTSFPECFFELPFQRTFLNNIIVDDKLVNIFEKVNNLIN